MTTRRYLRATAARKLSTRQVLLSSLAPVGSQIAKAGGDVAKVQGEWRAWNEQHGLRYRFETGRLTPRDRERLDDLSPEDAIALTTGPPAPPPPDFLGGVYDNSTA